MCKLPCCQHNRFSSGFWWKDIEIIEISGSSGRITLRLMVAVVALEIEYLGAIIVYTKIQLRLINKL